MLTDLRAKEFGEVWGDVEGDPVEGALQGEPPDDHTSDDYVREQGSEVDDLSRDPDAFEDAEKTGNPADEEPTCRAQHYIPGVGNLRGIVFAQNSPPANKQFQNISARAKQS